MTSTTGWWLATGPAELLALAARPDVAVAALDDLRLGRAVFTTARVDDGAVVWPEAHATRLAADGSAIGAPPLAVDATTALLMAAAHETAVLLGPQHVLRAVHTASGALLVNAAPARALVDQLRAATVDGGRRPAAVKSTSWAWSDEAARRAASAGADVALLTEAGTVLEFAAANVVVVRDGVARTPAADGRLLPGLTRAALLAADVGLEAGPVTVTDLASADEVVLLSALRGAVAVVAIDDAHVGDGLVGSWTRQAQVALADAGLRRDWPAARQR